MNGSLVRCLIVDLAGKKTTCQEWSRDSLSDGLGTYGIYLDELGAVWQDDPEAAALAAGPLTGTSVPGSGGMSWCRMGPGGLAAEHTEGRLGAALRFAGWDHLIITGVSSERTDLLIEDGSVVFRPATAHGDHEAWQQLLKERPDENSVAALTDARGIREDPYFLTGSWEMSRALQNKGLRAVIITGRGSVEARCPEELLRESLALCAAFRESGEYAGSRKQPARYMSASHIWEEDKPEPLPAMPLAFLGLGWDDRFPGGDMMERAAQLLNCCVQGAWDKEKLMEARERIERGMEGHGRTVL